MQLSVPSKCHLSVTSYLFCFDMRLVRMNLLILLNALRWNFVSNAVFAFDSRFVLRIPKISSKMLNWATYELNV